MNKYKNRSNISGTIIHNSRIEHNLFLEHFSNKLELLGVTLYPNDIYSIEKEQRILKDFELMVIRKIIEFYSFSYYNICCSSSSAIVQQ